MGMKYEEAENEKLAKSYAKKFLGDEKGVQEQFDLDTLKPPPPAPAPAISWDVLNILSQNSQLIYGIFATIVISVVTYYLSRRASEKDKQKIIPKIEEILREKQEPIKEQIKRNRKL